MTCQCGDPENRLLHHPITSPCYPKGFENTGEPQFDVINKAPQYNQHPSGVEAISICRHLTGDWFNAFKYVFRAEFKGGRQDIEKAIYYAKDGVAHSIPMWLPSYDEDVRRQLIRVMNAETGRRFSYFFAFESNMPREALRYAEHILASYP